MKGTTRVLTLGRFDKRRGQRYNAIFNGERIVTDAIGVEYAACRVLAARGVTGRLETWRPGAPHASMVIRDIEEAADSVRENRARVRARSATNPSLLGLRGGATGLFRHTYAMINLAAHATAADTPHANRGNRQLGCRSR